MTLRPGLEPGHFFHAGHIIETAADPRAHGVFRRAAWRVGDCLPDGIVFALYRAAAL